MILKKISVKPMGTNVYIFGSNETKEVVIIDPGGEGKKIIEEVENIGLNPTVILLTHAHYDHVLKIGKVRRHFDLPLMYSKTEYDKGIYTRKEADKWLKEGDIVNVGPIKLHVLETPGHSPGSLSYYTKDVDEYNGRSIDGIIFTGDLIFRRSIGRSDLKGGDQNTLFSSIREKIMENPDITDNFLVCPGHMGITTVAEERKNNMYSQYFT